MKNKNSLDIICAALTTLMGIDTPEMAASPNEDLLNYAKSIFGGKKVDRIFMYGSAVDI